MAKVVILLNFLASTGHSLTMQLAPTWGQPKHTIKCPMIGLDVIGQTGSVFSDLVSDYSGGKKSDWSEGEHYFCTTACFRQKS